MKTRASVGIVKFVICPTCGPGTPKQVGWSEGGDLHVQCLSCKEAIATFEGPMVDETEEEDKAAAVKELRAIQEKLGLSDPEAAQYVVDQLRENFPDTYIGTDKEAKEIISEVMSEMEAPKTVKKDENPRLVIIDDPGTRGLLH